MKRRIFSILTFLILMFFVGGFNILANTGTIQEKGYLYYENDTVGIQNNRAFNGYPSFYYKYSDQGVYVCATGLEINPPIGQSCSAGTISVDIGLAYLVNEYTGQEGGVSSMSEVPSANYYWLELATLYYLGNFQTDSYPNFMTNIYSTKLLTNNKTFEITQSEARNYQAKYEKDIQLTLSSTNLEFSLGEDGYLYSQKVYITDVNSNVDSDSINIHVDNKKFTILDSTDANGRYFQLKILREEVAGNNLSVNVNVTGSHEYYIANYYECSGSVQNLISTKTTLQPREKTVTASGEVSATKLVIRKTDEKGNLLSGAKIKVENEDKTYSKEFNTTDEEIVIEDLEYGIYKITELDCPEGYVISNKSQDVTLSEENLSNTVTIKNNLTRVEISKINSVDSNLLSGAVLQIQDKDGNVVKDKSGKEYEWTSSDQVYVVEGLLPGIYYLVEKSAPEGYELNSQKIEFVVDDETEVVKVEMKNNIEVKVPDTLSSRSTLLIAISMFDIALGIGILTYVKKNKYRE